MERSDIADLAAEALAGACAAVAVAVILDKSEGTKKIAQKVPRLGWKGDDQQNPPVLARLIAGALASIIFRSTFSVTRTAARSVL